MKLRPSPHRSTTADQTQEPRRQLSKGGAVELGVALAVVSALVAALIHRRRTRGGREARKVDRSELVIPRSGGRSMTVRGADGVELHTVIEGDGPTVVLAHGIAVTERFWLFTRAGLVNRGFRVVTFDQRGHGASNVGSLGYSVEVLGDDLAAVLEDLDVRDVVVVGHSMGGIALQSLLVHHRDLVDRRVRHAVICSSTPRNEGAWRLFERVPLLRDGVDIDVPRAAVASAVRRVMFGAHPPPDPALVELALELVRDQRPEHLAAAALALTDFDLRPQLRDVTTPVTVVCGTEDLVTLPRGGRELMSCLPHAEEIWFDGAGHAVPWERAGQFVELVATR